MKVTNWREFAKVTIKTNDLDPAYVFLHNAKADQGDDWASRFVMHYLSFYDMGEAIRAADETTQDTFWEYLKFNYADTHRGVERRHSRGALGEKYLTNLAERGTPGHIWDQMYASSYTDMVDLFKKEFQGCGFGPYFLWKVLDFQERVWCRPISLSINETLLHLPDDPRKCAKILWPDMPLRRVLEMVTDYISQFPAPPGYDRPCSYQEAETVLCMLKGYFITKTHTIGDDIDSKYKQLANFPNMLKYLPPKLDWSQYERGALVP